MTPNEEIKFETGRRHDEICDDAFEYHCRWQNRPPEWRPDIATAFNDGAKWADEHPHRISVKMTPNEEMTAALAHIIKKMQEQGASQEVVTAYRNGFTTGAMWRTSHPHWISEK